MKDIELVEVDRIKHHSGTPDTIEYDVKNAPYTVFGHSCLTPSFSLIMKASGLKKILEHADDTDDSIRITFTEYLDRETGNKRSYIDYHILKRDVAPILDASPFPPKEADGGLKPSEDGVAADTEQDGSEGGAGANHGGEAR